MLSSWAQVLDYCRASMGFASKEQFRMLCGAGGFTTADTVVIARDSPNAAFP